jgi:hypothetical protein
MGSRAWVKPSSSSSSSSRGHSCTVSNRSYQRAINIVSWL